ncbi:MAG: biosynthetic-type acetolactate synthase large subunit [Solirubrobacteraceae bacterium]|nr:biosynthetic-type acetolactate synthase large subunit [Solirubrobacteraceae bacterium]
MRAVDAIMECLKAEGVEVVFGYPGGANLPTYDAFVDAGIRHVLVRHEAGGGHAAEGYAKSTGKTAVCLGTSGPGATNLVTPIMDAMMDSVPVVFITGQVRTDLLGTDGFQEADILGITMPAVKHSWMISDPADIPQAIHEAFHVASTGRPGPVVVDIPTDLSKAEIPYEIGQETPLDLPGYQPKFEGNMKQIRQAARALAAAKRPLLYVGGGAIASGARDEVRQLAEVTGAPVTCTLMALGTFPAPHDQWLGMPGMHGTRTANYTMDEADLVFSIGARFDDRITGKLSEFAPNAKFIHLDIDPAEIGKNVPAHIPIVGDAKQVLTKLIPEYESLDADKARLDEWWERIRAWQAKYPLSYEESTDSEIKSPFAIDAVFEASSGKAIVTSDVGQHQMWTAQRYHFSEPRAWINSGGLGTMGFGLPAAIGCQVGNPDDLVICVTGDGSIQMNIQEMATAVQEGLPIKVVILNNGYLGMVRQWQELFWDKRYSHVDMRPEQAPVPDWQKLAEAYGWSGVRLEKKETLVDDLRAAFNTDGPVLIDVRVAREENVYPMIAPGAAARDMVG